MVVTLLNALMRLKFLLDSNHPGWVWVFLGSFEFSGLLRTAYENSYESVRQMIVCCCASFNHTEGFLFVDSHVQWNQGATVCNFEVMNGQVRDKSPFVTKAEFAKKASVVLLYIINSLITISTNDENIVMLFSGYT